MFGQHMGDASIAFSVGAAHGFDVLRVEFCRVWTNCAFPGATFTLILVLYLPIMQLPKLE